MVLVCLGISACSSRAPAPSSDSNGIGPQASDETDGSVAPGTTPGTADTAEPAKDSPQPGTARAHVWFPTSVGIELRTEWALSGGSPNSGSSCLKLDRSAMSPAQLDALTNVILRPLTGACTSDGFSYTELKVFDADGTVATYRDTGCEYLVVAGATAMLPNDSLGVFSGAGTKCTG